MRTVLGAINAGRESTKKIDVRWKWHYGVLLSLRERLLSERCERLSEAAQPLEMHSMDLADSATDEFDHNLTLGQLSAEEDALCEVDDSLHRILNGSYGMCEETGKPIPAARLKAVPWTRFTREVEERLEKEGSVKRPHLGKVGSVCGTVTGDLAEEAEEFVANDEALWACATARSKRKAHGSLNEKTHETHFNNDRKEVRD